MGEKAVIDLVTIRKFYYCKQKDNFTWESIEEHRGCLKPVDFGDSELENCDSIHLLLIISNHYIPSILVCY